MPIHDWSRGDSLFHSFHLGWVVQLCQCLNKGVLPSSCYAMSETFDHRLEPGFLEMGEPEHRFTDPGLPGEIRHVEDQPPRTHSVISSNQVENACRAVTIRSCDTHHVEAAILFVCQQDKQTRARLEKFAEQAVAALSHGIHLLIIDLFPPSRRDPQGIHKAIWDRLRETPFTLPPEKPLTLVSYAVGRETTVYVERFSRTVWRLRRNREHPTKDYRPGKAAPFRAGTLFTP
jgi:hypothetical protein